MTRIGLPRVHHRVLDSTNERAKALARAGAPHGTVVTADEQTAGRGRQGRAWVASPGSALLISLVVRGLEERRHLLPLIAAVAVCEAAEASAEVPCSIKWPNDVWIRGRKLAGVLIEANPQEGWAVLGVGLNVATRTFPPELSQSATSLTIEGSRSAPPTAESVLCELLLAIERWLGEAPESLLDTWRARDALHGSKVAWSDGEGTAAGIEDSGCLLVDTPGGRVRLEAGEVHLRSRA